MSTIKRCAACGKQSPVSTMKTCMHAEMHNYVCDSKCMNDFYNPPKRPAPSLPAAGSAVEEAEVVAWMTTGVNPPLTRRSFTVSRADAQVQHRNWLPHYEQLRTDELMTVAQHERIVAALSAQQSVHVSVPRELLERVESHLDRTTFAPFGEPLPPDNTERRELRDNIRALLNGGEA